MSVLTQTQLEQYEEDGCLLVSGLIPESVAEQAETAMWELMEMDPDDSSTWDTPPIKADDYNTNRGLVIFNGKKEPELLACATPEFMTATAELIGENPGSLHHPEAVHTQNLLPTKGDWSMPRAHVDGIPKEHLHKTFPGPYRIAMLVYLNDVERHGGGTAVWPGSYRKIRELAESDRDKHEYLFHLNKHIPDLDLGEGIELTPKRGDVLFFTYLAGHNGTANRSHKPRWMMRYFCSCKACGKWKKTDDWNHWTP